MYGLILSLALAAPAPKLGEDRLVGVWHFSLGAASGDVELVRGGVCRQSLADSGKFTGEWSYSEKGKTLYLRLHNGDYFLKFDRGWPPKVKAATVHARGPGGERAPQGLPLPKPVWDKPQP
jgi:hypothetical protein